MKRIKRYFVKRWINSLAAREIKYFYQEQSAVEQSERYYQKFIKESIKHGSYLND